MDENNNTKKHRAISLRPGAAVYAVLLVFAFFMTQILANPISAVFFWFLLMLLPVSFLLMLIGSAVMQVYVFCDKNVTEKHSPVAYEIRIINSSPIPFPFVEAVMTKPEDSGIRSVKQRLVLSMAPFGGYSVKTNVAFRYRGLYEIGVSELYIYDPMRMFCIRKDIRNYQNVNVAPRILELDSDMDRASSDIPSPVSRVSATRERVEVSNIREYRAGDQLKNVHWKLSSKAENLQVKDYSTNNDKHTYIFIDLAAPTPFPEPEVKQSRGLKKLFDKNKLKAEKTEKITEKTEKLSKVMNTRRRRRLRSRGLNSKDAETIEMIDALIYETSSKGKAKKQKEAEKAAAALEKSELQAKAAQKLEAMAEAKKTEQMRHAEAIAAWGGRVLPEYEDEIAEYCADGVVEIAVAAIMSELRNRNRCTVAWYDTREKQSVVSCEISDSADLMNIVNRFSTAPVVSRENRVSAMTRLIGEAVNVTVKIITSNIDPISVNEYCTVPTAFGGAGTGCSAEILLFNPEDKYSSSTQRLEYASSVYLQLRKWGVDMMNIKEREGSDGGCHLYNFNA